MMNDTDICRSCGCEYWLHWPEDDGCSVSIDNDHYCDCKGFVAPNVTGESEDDAATRRWAELESAFLERRKVQSPDWFPSV